MKYIITEQQNERLVNQIMKFLDKNLTPDWGWSKTKEYEKTLKSEDELFIFLYGDEDEIYDASEFPHMYYATCDNQYITIEENGCPIVLLPQKIYFALEGYFGDFWKPFFLKWFETHTNLPIKKVDNLGF